MEEIELRKLILRGEDSGLQFKQQIDSCEKLAPEIVALLNKRGGQILIGVNDDGDITGLSRDQVATTNQHISNTTESHVVPRITVDTENVVTSDGTVIVLTVPEGIDKPYQTNKGHFYVKSGSDKRHITHRDELRRDALVCDLKRPFAEQVEVEVARWLEVVELGRDVAAMRVAAGPVGCRASFAHGVPPRGVAPLLVGQISTHRGPI